MKTYTTIKTINTACGKTVSYLEIDGQTAKMHSTTGPAIVYPDEELKAPEYYLFGIQYPKPKWKELVNLQKATPNGDVVNLEPYY
jgi:hypothetical protein